MSQPSEQGRQAHGAGAARLLALIALLATAPGCGVDVYDDAIFLVDAELLWSINGSTSPALCDVYGIEDWVIEVRGPDTFDVFIDCRANFWESEADLYGLLEGFYTIRVVALDLTGRTLAALETQLDLFDRGFIEVIELTFIPSDF